MQSAQQLIPQRIAWLKRLVGIGGVLLFASTWRLWTQPVHWLLMLLLAGWLLEGALVTAREWWSERHAD